MNIRAYIYMYQLQHHRTIRDSTRSLHGIPARKSQVFKLWVVNLKTIKWVTHRKGPRWDHSYLGATLGIVESRVYLSEGGFCTIKNKPNKVIWAVFQRVINYKLLGKNRKLHCWLTHACNLTVPPHYKTCHPCAIEWYEIAKGFTWKHCFS